MIVILQIPKTSDIPILFISEDPFYKDLQKPKEDLYELCMIKTKFILPIIYSTKHNIFILTITTIKQIKRKKELTLN